MAKHFSCIPFRTLVVLVFTIVTTALVAQSRNERLGNKYFEEYSYDRAIRYLEAIKETDKTVDIRRKLAISHFKLEDFAQSEWYFTQVVKSDEVEVEDYFNYSQVLAMQENYPESVRWMTVYHEKKSEQGRPTKFNSDPEYYLDLIQQENGYAIKNISINSDQQEFGTNFFGDEIVFASTRSGLQTVVRKWNWNQLPFLDIYKATVDTATMELGEPEAHHKKFNRKYHEGPASFNEAGDIMVYTSNSYKGRNSNDVVTLELFESKLVDGKWSRPKPLPFNNREYSVGHGSLTKDGNTLYFVSDMPGSRGGTDIYVSQRNSEGEWGDPKRLSDDINTEGNEMFPFFHPDSILFFASNGHPGLGGLDMFFIDTRERGIKRTTNMNAPINSSRDDFAFIMNDERTKGYFSSNRIGGLGNDDIYAYEREEPLRFNQLLKGKVIDELGRIVPMTRVLLYDVDGNLLSEVTTGEDGQYQFELEEGAEFALIGEKEGHSQGLSKVEVDPKTRDHITDVMIRKPIDNVDGVNNPFDLMAHEVVIDDEVLVYKDYINESPGLSLHSMVRDIATGEPVKGSQVIIYDKITGEETLMETPSTGDNTWYLDPKKYANGRYSVKIETPGYKPMEFDLETPHDKMGQHAFMARMIPHLAEGESLDLDLKEVFNVGPIYFDLDKHDIRPDARPVLDKVIDLMHKYPDMVIELTSHTDCRASKRYNTRLSDNRARETAKYIRAKLMDQSRVTGEGLGEMDLVNDCECEGEVVSDCSEDEHQRNRRTEFKIIRM